MVDLRDKQVLITGGCGSIGSQIVERVLEQEPRSIRIFDANEHGLFRLQRQYEADRDILRFLIGDVRNRDRLEMAMEDVDVVFHAAALKHVELNEYNPFETVQTNVQGTQNLVRAALEEEVEAVVGISTDKASNPTSVMGATKLLAERLIVAGNAYKGGRDTRLGCVRFGNVLESSGSVVPLFKRQISDGGPITVTDPEMTRFLMPPEVAVDLVLEAYDRMAGGEVFVLKMPAFRLNTLAEAMREEYAPVHGYESDEIETEIVGRRPGERVHEKLVSEDELIHARELEDMYVLLPQIELTGYEHVAGDDGKPVGDEYTSDHTDLLSEDEIIDLIEGRSGHA